MEERDIIDLNSSPAAPETAEAETADKAAQFRRRSSIG